MNAGQSLFRLALLDPALGTPEGLIDPQGRPAGKRFDVYRNNVAVSLTEALVQGFPVLHRLLGDEFFRAMAGVYLRQHPPGSQLMMFYGSGMPGFLQGFEPVERLGYLPDVARLELARRAAYHAADATPIAPEAIQSLIPDRILTARLKLAPAVRVLRSDWPVLGIWRANMEPDAPKPGRAAEDVLITRPDYDPVQHLLPDGGADFIETLQKGTRFGVALEIASRDRAFDLTTTLGLMLSGKAIVGIQTED